MGIGQLCCFVAPCGSLQHHQSGMKNFKAQVQTTKYCGTNRTKRTLADNNITEQIVQNIHWQTTKYHGTYRTKHALADKKCRGTNGTKHILANNEISRNKSYKTYTSSLCEMMLPNAVQKRTLDVYRCDETWEFINLALLCVACLLSERKGSMCPGVMIDNARKDACTECSICQSPRFAK